MLYVPCHNQSIYIFYFKSQLFNTLQRLFKSYWSWDLLSIPLKSRICTTVVTAPFSVSNLCTLEVVRLTEDLGEVGSGYVNFWRGRYPQRYFRRSTVGHDGQQVWVVNWVPLPILNPYPRTWKDLVKLYKLINTNKIIRILEKYLANGHRQNNLDHKNML